jgi:anti-sigma regulatory factor (Ser/Thr protein kinase)
VNHGADGDSARDFDPEPEPLPRPVTAAEVGDMRRRVMRAAHEAGLDGDRAHRFTVAVNEIVINAIQHGGGTAEVTISDGGGRVVVTVLDSGPGLGGDIEVRLPPPDRTHGRGLWLAHQLCDDITIGTSTDGTFIRLRAAPRAA